MNAPITKGMMSSKTPEYETPQDFFNRLDTEFHFTLDAAATAQNAKCEHYYTVQDNALWQSWSGTVWCNPPYGNLIAKFVRKAYGAAQQGATVVMLIPSRTDTRYWHDYVMKAKEIRFVSGRLKFGPQEGPAPFPSAVVIFEQGAFVPTISTIKAVE